MTSVAVSGSPVAGPKKKKRKKSAIYPDWFYIPAAVIYTILYLVPTVASLYFSLTRWTLFNSEFIGLSNFYQFFSEPNLVQSLINTVIFAVLTSGAKVVLGLLLGVLLTSNILFKGMLRSVVFFPVLVSVVGVGITFQVLMYPTNGLINVSLAALGIDGPGWLTDPKLALYSVAMVDIWRGVGLATVIYMAGIVSIPQDYYEASRIDGATKWQQFWNITVPLVKPAMTTVIILSFIGGLRLFDLIWAMTKGGPGFSSDVMASVIYKQYQAGYYGLSTAGNVVLFALIAFLAVPLSMFLNRKEVDR